MERKNSTAQRGTSQLAIVTMMMFATIRVAQADRVVKVAAPTWATQIEATSRYANAHAAWNAADGSIEPPIAWAVPASFGLFEAAPGLLSLTRPANRITVVNAFSDRLVGRLEGVEGTWRADIFDYRFKPAGSRTLKIEEGGLSLNLRGRDACFTVVLTRSGLNDATTP